MAVLIGLDADFAQRQHVRRIRSCGWSVDIRRRRDPQRVAGTDGQRRRASSDVVPSTDGCGSLMESRPKSGNRRGKQGQQNDIKSFLMNDLWESKC